MLHLKIYTYVIILGQYLKSQPYRLMGHFKTIVTTYAIRRRLNCFSREYFPCKEIIEISSLGSKNRFHIIFISVLITLVLVSLGSNCNVNPCFDYNVIIMTIFVIKGSMQNYCN